MHHEWSDQLREIIARVQSGEKSKSWARKESDRQGISKELIQQALIDAGLHVPYQEKADPAVKPAVKKPTSRYTEAERKTRRAIKQAVDRGEFSDLHKQKKLTFAAIPVSQVRESRTKRLLHQSKGSGRQGSQYYADVINGNLVYIRVSNHWGTFTTNVYAGTKEAQEKFGDTQGDQYGRVGWAYHEWKLSGGRRNKDGTNYHGSQAGYVVVGPVPEE